MYDMCHVNRDSLTHCSQGSVAQLVEQRTSNPKVVGSIPPEPLNFSMIQLVVVSVGYHHIQLDTVSKLNLESAGSKNPKHLEAVQKT